MFEGTKSVTAVSDVVKDVPAICVLSPSDESLNTACSPGTSGRDIVCSDAGSGSGATRGAKFAKRLASKNNYRETGCNKLAERLKWPVMMAHAPFLFVRV